MAAIESFLESIENDFEIYQDLWKTIHLGAGEGPEGTLGTLEASRRSPWGSQHGHDLAAGALGWSQLVFPNPLVGRGDFCGLRLPLGGGEPICGSQASLGSH